MTPRTMENSLHQVFSELILLQKNEEFDSFDLRESTPLMRPLHPKMVKALLNFMDNPQQEASRPILQGKHYACYPNLDEAQRDFPDLQVVKGMPYGIFSAKDSTVLFDFLPFGAVVSSTDELNEKGPPGVHQHTLPVFLEYALSPELWGSQGKWTRFHQRLHTQFDKFQLLNGKSLPGRYPLKPHAQKLEKKGIKGTLHGDSYILTLPWTFPLTALEKLEAVIQQEF